MIKDHSAGFLLFSFFWPALLCHCFPWCPVPIKGPLTRFDNFELRSSMRRRGVHDHFCQNLQRYAPRKWVKF
uniref:Putative secreted protein synganglion overexpressed n=1 Tax=Rhipicephalus microplus TaxID=6941 RepID=A0A6M2DCG3_RHIMP